MPDSSLFQARLLSFVLVQRFLSLARYRAAWFALQSCLLNSYVSDYYALLATGQRKSEDLCLDRWVKSIEYSVGRENGWHTAGHRRFDVYPIRHTI